MCKATRALGNTTLLSGKTGTLVRPSDTSVVYHSTVTGGGRLTAVSLSAEHGARRRFGVFDTPPHLSALVLRQAEQVLGRPPSSVLDPAAGTGVFLTEAKALWPNARLSAFELDCARAMQASASGAQLLGADFLSAHPQARFDLVVGNPPWVSYSGRHAQTPLGELPETRGWRSLHSVFLLRASEWVAPGGVMAMLAPATVMHQAGYAHLREHLASRGRLDWLTDVPQNAFARVTMPYVVLVWHEGKRTNLRPSTSRPLPPAAPIFSDPGVHTGNAADLLIHREPSQHRVRIRVGRDVRAFALEPPSLWLEELRVLPPGRYARFGASERQVSVPVVLRQTASRPIAALHSPPTRFRNSVLACSGLAEHEPEYVVGVLNSRVAAVLYRLQNPDATQRAFPQIKVGGLSRLPLARCEAGAAEMAEPVRLAEQWLGRRLLHSVADLGSGTS